MCAEAPQGTRHGTTDWENWENSKLGKEYDKVVYCHLAYLTNMQRTSYEMLGWMNSWN